MTRITVFAVTAALGLALAPPARAASVNVGSGATLNLGTGSLSLGCADLTVTGTLSAGTVGFTGARDVTIDPSGVVNGNSATLQLAGDWDKSGTFNAGTSVVQMVNGCSVSSSVVSGTTTFATLSIGTTAAKQVSFTTGATQTVTTLLSLLGAPGNLLTLRSTSSGNSAYLNVTGGSSADYVNVDDVDATPGNDVTLGPNSVAGSNAPGWSFGAAVPLLGPIGIGALALLLLASGWRRLVRPTREVAGL